MQSHNRGLKCQRSLHLYAYLFIFKALLTECLKTWKGEKDFPTIEDKQGWLKSAQEKHSPLGVTFCYWLWQTLIVNSMRPNCMCSQWSACVLCSQATCSSCVLSLLLNYLFLLSENVVFVECGINKTYFLFVDYQYHISYWKLLYLLLSIKQKFNCILMGFFLLAMFSST